MGTKISTPIKSAAQNNPCAPLPLPTPSPLPSATKKIISGNIGIGISLIKPFSLNAGLKFDDKIYDLKDPYVNKIAFRSAIASRLQEDPNILGLSWRESAAMVEIGPAGCLSLPVECAPGVGLSLSLGFETKALVAYRYARPKIAYRVNPKSMGKKAAKIFFPNSVQKAREMPLGAEIEIKGQGRLQLSESININAGAGVLAVAKVGVAASLAASQSMQGEYGLTVIKLGDDKVRVLISKINESDAQIGLEIRLGLLKILDPWSSSHDNGLKRFCMNAAVSEVEKLVRDYASALLSFTSRSGLKNSHICAYDLDLASSAAQEAYACLLHLRVADVERLAEQKNSAITRIRWQEHEKNTTHTINIKAFNQPLLMRQIADIKSEGMFISSDDSQAIYCDKVYAEKFYSIIRGSRDIRWETIEVTDDNKNFINYFRFFYTQCANIPTQQEVDKFFLLAERLGIKTTGASKRTLIEMSKIKMLSAHNDDTSASVEIFFTQKGLNMLQQADAHRGMKAFISANAYGPSHGEHIYAEQILENYHRLKNDWWGRFSDCGHSRLSEIEQEYEVLCGRNLVEDYNNFLKAKNFGKMVSSFSNAKNKQDARDFFSILGKSDFGYEEILVALAELVGRENLLVHKLAMSGGSIELESIDEGEITHPRDRARNLFGRPAYSLDVEA